MDDKEIAIFLEKMVKVRKAITDYIAENGLKKKSTKGQIACPVCGGTVAWSYAGSYNRHIHATCSTEGCVSWME